MRQQEWERETKTGCSSKVVTLRRNPIRAAQAPAQVWRFPAALFLWRYSSCFLLWLPFLALSPAALNAQGIPGSSLAHGRNSSGLWPMKETTGKLSFPPYVMRCHDLKAQGWRITADTWSLKTYKYVSCLIKEVDCCIKAWVNIGCFLFPPITYSTTFYLFVHL